MNTKFFILIIFIAIVASFAGFQFFLDETYVSVQTQDEIKKTKLDIKSLFNIYGYEDNFRIQDGKKIWNDPKFELNPENNDLYSELNYSPIENAVVIYPIFTASAYSEPGFYTFFRGECGQECLTDEIDSEYSLDFVASGNGYQVLNLLGYPIITDIDVDQNPEILEKYDKVILLHNEYVTKKEFDAITNHPKVLYLYPNALYAEVEVDYEKNTISLIRGHNFPEPEIVNGFDWEFDNSNLEYDMDCKDMGFYRIVNGWMLNCYPENPIHQSKVLLQMIKDF
ncbi:hypothetical protein [Nitrosopumilus sp.]|uniref:hypothetical protein n=1 Tax=Nitrosopumilus sp. TaxID=2024843 RepID=UPI00247BBF21|nr:hypothetical protein [Nitrosopumilus sp.]MCV0409584.1 hypothetical protein [Nitrosopumilus sp.]